MILGPLRQVRNPPADGPAVTDVDLLIRPGDEEMEVEENLPGESAVHCLRHQLKFDSARHREGT